MSIYHCLVDFGLGYGQITILQLTKYYTTLSQRCVTARVVFGFVKCTVHSCVWYVTHILCTVDNWNFPIPGDIIRHCADLLTDNGVLLITYLCAHDQDWVKQACCDLWLGFDPSEITDWAEIAGLTEGNSLFLTQRNGFRIQLRQFKKAATTN